MKQLHGIDIHEVYKDFSPPFDVRKTVNRLLNGIPCKYLAGIKTIVITNSANLSHDERRRKVKAKKHKYRVAEC